MSRSSFLIPILALLAALTAFDLSACRDKKSADYLAYQREGGSYICKITRGDAVYEAILELNDPMRLTFSAPDTLAGYCFERSDEGIRLLFGDLALSAAGSELPERLFGLFSLSPGDFLSASRETVSGEEITVVNFQSGQVLRLSSDGLPLMLSEGDLTVNVKKQ